MVSTSAHEPCNSEIPEHRSHVLPLELYLYSSYWTSIISMDVLLKYVSIHGPTFLRISYKLTI